MFLLSSEYSLECWELLTGLKLNQVQVLVTLICAWLENQVCAKWLQESLCFGVSTPPSSAFVPALSERFPWLVFHICLPFVPLTWKNPELQVRSFWKELPHSPDFAVGIIQRLPAGVKVLVEEITLAEKKGERNCEQREKPAEAASVSRGRAGTSTQILFSVQSSRHYSISFPKDNGCKCPCLCICSTGVTYRKVSCCLFTFGMIRAFDQK